MQGRTFTINEISFNGPLELLLELIEARKLLINDVSLSSVTEEYISYAKTLDEHSISETSQFVSVASTLLLIKSKSLLPILELTEEETANVHDLEYRLKLYKVFRDAARLIEERFGETVLYERKYQPNAGAIFVTDRLTSIPALYEAIRRVLQGLARTPFVRETVVAKIVSLEEMVSRLEERIMRQFRMSFKEFAGEAGERGTFIVGFLAVLELVKQGLVNARQESIFSDIHIEKESVDTPKYS